MIRIRFENSDLKPIPTKRLRQEEWDTQSWKDYEMTGDRNRIQSWKDLETPGGFNTNIRKPVRSETT